MASASLPQELTEGTEAVEHFTYNNVEDERFRTFSHASVLKLSGKRCCKSDSSRILSINGAFLLLSRGNVSAFLGFLGVGRGAPTSRKSCRSTFVVQSESDIQIQILRDLGC
jgi:hypothetical protein